MKLFHKLALNWAIHRAQLKEQAERKASIASKWGTVIDGIQIGGTYLLKREESNPFGEKKVAVKVKDVQKGWVLYAFLPKGSLFQNESVKVRTFLDVFVLQTN